MCDQIGSARLFKLALKDATKYRTKTASAFDKEIIKRWPHDKYYEINARNLKPEKIRKSCKNQNTGRAHGSKIRRKKRRRKRKSRTMRADNWISCKKDSRATSSRYKTDKRCDLMDASTNTNFSNSFCEVSRRNSSYNEIYTFSYVRESTYSKCGSMNSKTLYSDALNGRKTNKSTIRVSSRSCLVNNYASDEIWIVPKRPEDSRNGLNRIPESCRKQSRDRIADKCQMHSNNVNVSTSSGSGNDNRKRSSISQEHVKRLITNWLKTRSIVCRRLKRDKVSKRHFDNEKVMANVFSGSEIFETRSVQKHSIDEKSGSSKFDVDAYLLQHFDIFQKPPGHICNEVAQPEFLMGNNEIPHDDASKLESGFSLQEHFDGLLSSSLL